MSKTTKIVERILAYLAALILLQTLYFKFSGAEESKYIFSKLGMEPAGRIGSGVFELIAGILLIIPRTAIWGAILSLGVISGAILSHIFILGIEVQNADGQGDGGQLFIYACIVLLASAAVVSIRNEEVFLFLKRFRKN